MIHVYQELTLDAAAASHSITQEIMTLMTLIFGGKQRSREGLKGTESCRPSGQFDPNFFLSFVCTN